MIAIGEFALNVLVNSLWQIPAIWLATVVGTFLLKNCSAQYRYLLWIVALSLCLIAPLASAGGLRQVFPRAETTTSLAGRQTPTAPAVKNDGDQSSPLTRVSNRTRQIEINASSKIIQLTLIGYVLFILLCIVRLVRQWLAMTRLKNTATDVGLPISIETKARYCRNLFQLKDVVVMRSETARVPCTLGTRQPVIVLPNSFCSIANDETILSVIAHEMAHVRRRDFFTKLLCEFISLPVSFHPMIGFIKRKIEREREMACDELVTRRAVLRETYARSLLTAADLAVLPMPRTVALSIFDGRSLEQRIKQLIENRLLWSRRTARIITVCVVAGVCLSALVSSAFGFELRARLNTLTMPIMSSQVFSEQQIRLEPASAAIDRTEQQTHKRLESPNPQERAEAACAAGRKGDVEGVPMLIAMLGDDSKTESMRCWESGGWGPALYTFKHPSPGEEAALALASMGRPAFTALVNQLDNSGPTTRRNAAWAIGELTNMLPGERASATPGLIALLIDADAWVRMAAARALGELSDRRATERLIATLLDSDWRVRQMSAWALSEFKDDRAVQALGTVLLSDSHTEVRRGAAEALGEIRSAEALPFLRQAVNDSEAVVSAKAQWAIAEIEDSDG